MSSIDQNFPSPRHNIGSITLPASSVSGEAADPSRSDQTSHGCIHPTPHGDTDFGWNDSCNTTVRGSDSGFLDIASQKQPRLFPTPNEVDEADLSNASELARTPPPLPHEESQYEETHLDRHRRGLSGTVQKLQDGCNKMLDIRLKADERRRMIRRDRQDLGDKDARFMQELRNVLHTSPDEKLKPLLDLCEEMQTLRNELFPQEDDYNILEDELISAEFEVQEIGGKLLTLLAGVRTSLQGDNDLSSLIEEDGAESERATIMGSTSQRPEAQEYLSRLGDRDIVVERLSDLRHERATLVEEEKSRARVGMVLSMEAQEFLDTFDFRHVQLQKELAIVEDDIAKLLKTMERTEGIFFATTLFDDPDNVIESAPDKVRHPSLNSLSEPIPSSEVALPSATQVTPLPNVDRPQSFSRDPLLLPADDIAPTFNRFPGADARSLTTEHHINTWLLKQQGTMSADAFINDWLLNVLRSSVSEVHQYKSSRNLRTLNVSQEGLRDLVLDWWSLDDAAGEYLKTLRLEARGLSLSATPALSTREARSDMFVITLNRLSGRLYRDCALRQVRETVRLTIRRPRSI